MLMQLGGAMRVGLANLAINYPVVGRGCYVDLKLGKITLTRYYNWTMFYQTMYERQHDDRIFGKQAVSEGLKDF